MFLSKTIDIWTKPIINVYIIKYKIPESDGFPIFFCFGRDVFEQYIRSLKAGAYGSNYPNNIRDVFIMKA